jgi:hypothetical protein
MSEQGGIVFFPVLAADFDSLVALRIAAMRESLERVGRFDPERARERWGAGLKIGLVVAAPDKRAGARRDEGAY